MGSWYTIVRYVPDVVCGEYCNIGVIVVSNTAQDTCCAFVSSWQRAQDFGGVDVGFLQVWAQNFESEVARGEMDRQAVEQMTQRFHQSVQMAPLCASLLSPQELLENCRQRFRI